MFKVLLIDDEFLVRQALRIIISEFNEFHVIGEAQNGRDALQLYEELTPDLIFMDIMMQGINGIDLSERIKARNPATTIVILTAYNDLQFTKKAMQLDIHHYLLKPFSLQEIYNVLQLYQETHIKKSFCTDSFVSDLFNKGFEESCAQIHEIIAEVFSVINLDNRYKILQKLMCDILQLIPSIDKTYIKYYKQKFPINESICKNISLAESWLFYLVDVVFKQKSIHTYPQFIKIFSYIDDNINNNSISLYSAAIQAELSMSYLSKLFKKEFKTNFNNYVNIKKIEKSKLLLNNNTISINDISFELGYNEPNYFCKVFKKFAGLTPSEYRTMKISGIK
ncbi:MAG: response regulator [Firmicutes bacterium]|nr:response regulator [Bacillota bacterium]